MILIGLGAIKSLCEGDLYADFAHVQADQQKAAWFESAIGMSCTSFDTEHFLPAKFCLNFTNVITPLDQ